MSSDPEPTAGPAADTRGQLTLGIVAHVDAGKTSLTERLLFDAGLTASLGSVDAGTTRTDSLEVERRRGITVRAAVTSLRLDQRVVTLIDTPGHPDFIAEVERSLTVLDAAVLVVSAVEGVQPQTVVIHKALQRIGVPTVVFVNKLDRRDADLHRTVRAIEQRLGSHAVSLCTAEDQGTAAVRVTARPMLTDDLVAAAADQDDRLLAQWIDHRPDHDLVRPGLARGVVAGTVLPVLAGSAMTGAGLSELRAAIASLLPAAPHVAGPLAASVFAIDRDDRGRRTWLRLWSGSLASRQRLAIEGDRGERVTEVAISRPDGLQVASRALAGQIVAIRGPEHLRIGDAVGDPPPRRRHHFTAGIQQSLVDSFDPRQRGALFAALTELAQEDPLIGLRLDEPEGVAPRAAVSVHGEVQREVIASMLEERFGILARFSELSVICIERLQGSGSAIDRIGENGNPYLASIGLQITPGAVGSGVCFDPGVERGHLPPAFIAATQEGARRALMQGRYGWQVTDCLVTMTASHYAPRQSARHQGFNKAVSSVGVDFRLLAQVVVTAALIRAGTQVWEPAERFELDLPAQRLAGALDLLRRRGARVDAQTSSSAGGAGRIGLTGEMPAALVPDLVRSLPDEFAGEAAFDSRFARYQRHSGDRTPRRRRVGMDPGDRRRWFREMSR